MVTVNGTDYSQQDLDDFNDWKAARDQATTDAAGEVTPEGEDNTYTDARGVGQPFDFDAGEYALNRGERTPFELGEAGNIDVLDQAADVSSQMMQGELPDDVKEQIRIRSAEGSLSRGLGIDSQASRNITARDLGRASSDYSAQGVQFGTAVGQILSQRDLVFKELRIKSATLNEDMRQWDDKFAAMMADSDMNAAKIGLAAIELQAKNRQFRIMEENKLIMANAQYEIEGLQQNLDSMFGSFDDFNTNLQQYVNLYG